MKNLVDLSIGKIVASLIAMVFILILVVTGLYVSDKALNDKSSDISIEKVKDDIEEKIEDNKVYVNYITDTEFYEKIDNKESFMVVISRTGCSHCSDYIPLYTKLLNEEKIEGYIVDIIDVEDEIAFLNDLGVRGTPTTLFYENGEEVLSKRIVGSRTYDQLRDLLVEREFIK